MGAVNRDDGRRRHAVEQMAAHALAPGAIANEHQRRATIDARHLARAVEPDRTGREAAFRRRDNPASRQRCAEFGVEVRPDEIANGKRRGRGFGTLD